MRGSVGKLGVLFHRLLRWAILAPAHIRGAVLYPLTHTIPLHGLMVKQMVRYFGQLEGERQIYWSATAVGAAAHVAKPRWAAHFVNAAFHDACLSTTLSPQSITIS